MFCFRDDSPQLFSSKYRSSSNTMKVRMVSDYSNNVGALSKVDEPLTGFKAHFYREGNNHFEILVFDHQTYMILFADINECAEMGPDVCDHFCNNYPGGYYCSCRYGYKLHSNKHSCVGRYFCYMFVC